MGRPLAFPRLPRAPQLSQHRGRLIHLVSQLAIRHCLTGRHPMPHFAHGVIDRGGWEPLREHVEEHPQQRPIGLGEEPLCRGRQRVGVRWLARSAAEPGLSHQPISLKGDQVRPHHVIGQP
jgi:hypothetical protein